MTTLHRFPEVVRAYRDHSGSPAPPLRVTARSGGIAWLTDLSRAGTSTLSVTVALSCDTAVAARAAEPPAR